MNRMIRIDRAALLLAWVTLPALAVAQSVSSAPGTTAPAVVSTPPAQPIVRSETEQLNRAANANAVAQNEANAQSQAEFERGMAEYRQAQAAAAAARERYEAELAEIRRKRAADLAAYEAEVARWQANVAACNAGDLTRCQSSGPAPRRP